MTIFKAEDLIGHLPGKPGLAGCPVDSQPPVTLILSILMGQAKPIHAHMM